MRSRVVYAPGAVAGDMQVEATPVDASVASWSPCASRLLRDKRPSKLLVNDSLCWKS